MDRTNVRVQGRTLAKLRALQTTYEQRTGIRPPLSSLLERVIDDSVERVGARISTLAVDTAPKAGT
jgi:hypothetical protein